MLLYSLISKNQEDKTCRISDIDVYQSVIITLLLIDPILNRFGIRRFGLCGCCSVL